MKNNKLVITISLEPLKRKGKEGEVGILHIEAKASNLKEIPQRQFGKVLRKELDKIWPQVEECQSVYL